MDCWFVWLFYFVLHPLYVGTFVYILPQGRPRIKDIITIAICLTGYGIYLNGFWSLFSSLLMRNNGRPEIVLALCGPVLFLYTKCLLKNYRMFFNNILPLILLVTGLFIYNGLSKSMFGGQHVLLLHLYFHQFFPIPVYLECAIVLSIVIMSVLGIKQFFIYIQPDSKKVNFLGLNLALSLLSIGIVSLYVFDGPRNLFGSYAYVLIPIPILFIGILIVYMVNLPINELNIEVSGPNLDTRYRASGLSTQFAEELKLQLGELMESEKPYLISDFTLDDLAGMINVSRHHASQLLNEYFEQSFYDFINYHRIKEAKKLLRNDVDKLSIDKIAFDCGFNNRISFYRVFKKHVGLAPSEYRDEN